MFKKSKAFTLAEALMVIVIIGVIAVVSLPILKTKLEIKGYHAALKKNYYVLKSALDRYAVDNYDPISSKESFAGKTLNLIAPYLNVHETCAYEDAGTGNCALASNYTDYSGTISYTGSDWIKVFYNHGQLILDDGTLLMFGSSFVTKKPSIISVDVNGVKKGPNRVGIDLYLFYLTDTGELLPMGAPETYYIDEKFCSESNASHESGFGCTYKVIMQER